MKSQSRGGRKRRLQRRRARRSRGRSGGGRTTPRSRDLPWMCCRGRGRSRHGRSRWRELLERLRGRIGKGVSEENDRQRERYKHRQRPTCCGTDTSSVVRRCERCRRGVHSCNDSLDRTADSVESVLREEHERERGCLERDGAGAVGAVDRDGRHLAGERTVRRPGSSSGSGLSSPGDL